MIQINQIRKQNQWWIKKIRVKKTDYNAKITEIESKIPSISGLASTTTLTIAENKYLMLVI